VAERREKEERKGGIACGDFNSISALN